MTSDEMTLERFDVLLPTLKFELLTYPDRYAYEGAGPRCLIARDVFDVLFENGEYTVFGLDDDEIDRETWCVMFNADNGERIEL